ncbi:MAG: cytochrome C [Nitrospirae bacterium]|nr:MAG: cytochrome C [Nitrospirota bacterium]
MRNSTSRLNALLFTGLIIVFGLIGSVQADDAGKGKRGDDASRVKRGFEIAPVPLNLHGKDRNLVGLGSYIVNGQGGCNDCHTWPSYKAGGDPFKGEPKEVNADGYMAGGRFFFAAPYPVALNGCVISRNLTPEDGKPAGLTLEEFLYVMRTGEDPDDRTGEDPDGMRTGGDLDDDDDDLHPPPRLLQVMPWPVYQDMTDRDLRAVYEYLSAIPSIPGEPQCP